METRAFATPDNPWFQSDGDLEMLVSVLPSSHDRRWVLTLLFMNPHFMYPITTRMMDVVSKHMQDHHTMTLCSWIQRVYPSCQYADVFALWRRVLRDMSDSWTFTDYQPEEHQPAVNEDEEDHHHPARMMMMMMDNDDHDGGGEEQTMKRTRRPPRKVRTSRKERMTAFWSRALELHAAQLDTSVTVKEWLYRFPQLCMDHPDMNPVLTTLACARVTPDAVSILFATYVRHASYEPIFGAVVTKLWNTVSAQVSNLSVWAWGLALVTLYPAFWKPWLGHQHPLPGQLLVQQCVQEMQLALERGLLPVHHLRAMQASPHMVSLFPSLPQWWDEVQHYQQQTEDMHRILLRWIPTSSEVALLGSLPWSTTLLPIQARTLWRQHQPVHSSCTTQAFREQFGPSYLQTTLRGSYVVPASVVQHTRWLHQVADSRAFALCWTTFSNNGTDISDIFRVKEQHWDRWMDTLADHTVLLTELTRFGPLLYNDNQGELRTTPLCRWMHTHACVQQDAALRSLLLLARHYVVPSEHHVFHTMEAALHSLVTTMPALHTYRDLEQHAWTYAQCIEPRLLHMSSPLLSAIKQYEAVLTWLRELRDDDQFLSSLDMARSLQEMNCPADVWDARMVPGRINEKYLSSVSNVRDYLYVYLYTEEPILTTAESFFHLFSSLDNEHANLIADNLATCFPVRASLASIVGIQSSAVASGSSRLTKLYSTECASYWRCQHNQGVVLRYQWDAVSWRQHSAHELLEFQSNLVLISHEQETPLVSTFLTQAEWMRRLYEAYQDLHASGHRDAYPTYQYDIPVSTSEETFREEVVQKEQLVQNWRQHVRDVRLQYTYINYFDMHRCTGWLSLSKSTQPLETILPSYLCLINVDWAHQHEHVRAVAHAWRQASVTTLVTLAQFLDQVLAEWPRRCRPCVVPTLDHYVSERQLRTGIYVSTGRYEQLRTLYAIQGSLGEWDTVVCCSAEETTQEQVELLLYRYYHTRPGGLYALVDVDLLSYEIQHACLHVLRSFPTTNSREGTLVLLPMSLDTCPLATPFLSNRLSVGIVPDNEWVTHAAPRHVQWYYSLHPGAGKSFHIRKQQQQHHYVHVPINQPHTWTSTLLHHLQEAQLRSTVVRTAPTTTTTTLHVDLAFTTTRNDMGRLLFSLCMLDVLVDPRSNTTFCCHPTTTHIAIEGPLHDTSYVTHLCNYETVDWEMDPHTLQQGMGAEFDAVIDPGCQENAYVRMQRVLQVLHKGKETAEGKQLAFPLLTHACPHTTSLWNLWSFINVVSRQLRQMQDPSSPIYLSCIPDPGNQLMGGYEVDRRLKERIQDELVAFVLQTATAFAIRQYKSSPSRTSNVRCKTLIGVHVRNFTGLHSTCTPVGRALLWTRESYNNDGRPVFKSPVFPNQVVHQVRTFYIYYREREHRWVFDDTVTSVGGVTAFSCTDGPLNTVLFERRKLEAPGDVYVQCTVTKGHYVDLHGFEKAKDVGKRGVFISQHDNGRYYQLGEDQNIGGFPHYYKTDLHPRHLYFDPKIERWIIAQTCNVAVMGNAHAYMHHNVPLTTTDKCRFSHFLENKIEDKMTIDFVYAEQEQEQGEKEDQGERALMEWKDSNHECMLFNNETGHVCFLSQNPAVLQTNMHPVLFQHLESNHIPVGQPVQTWDPWLLLSNITGVTRKQQHLQDPTFCLTTDALLKLMAIVYRIQCKIPVVLLGECGCGKTMLLNFLCQWLQVPLLTLDVHGGTSEDDILALFDRALHYDNTTVYVFLDEVNTCAHMGLLNEAMCHRTLYGRRLPDGIQILAAMNPHRVRSVQKEEMGLVQQQPITQSLVYQVHPIPPTLQEYMFDFGSLDEATELLYIRSMMSSSSSSFLVEGEEQLASWISKSQQFVRRIEGDPSVTSLRDVKRVLQLVAWFSQPRHDPWMREGEGDEQRTKVYVLALAHVYCYRLQSDTMRMLFWNDVCPDITHAMELVVRTQHALVTHFDIDEGLSMNDALRENLFVTLVCILNCIPIVIVGKPGTSKTLAMQVIASNVRGEKSAHSLWHAYPAVHIFSYQCSPLSTSHSIQHQFDAAKSFQEHAASQVITVLLLDEIGLAECSPNMPLKVLHYMLLDPPIAIVGISNWALDSSKMNRAICLQRPEPTYADLVLTGRGMLQQETNEEEEEEEDTWLHPIASAFHQLYTHQCELLHTPRPLIGMRDYYALLTLLRSGLPMHHVLQRTFGARPDALPIIYNLFGCAEEEPNVVACIRANVESTASSCRHLMVLSHHDNILPLLFGSGLLLADRTTVLLGSQFRDDLHELHFLRQILRVKQAMAEGRIVVLVHNDPIYESLYDLLNQRYVKHGDTRMLRLAMGSKSQLCPVHDDFKLVLIVDQQHAYEQLDLPLLNRFEKQVLHASDLVSHEDMHTAHSWCTRILEETQLPSLSTIFCGYNTDTLASLLANNKDNNKKIILANMASPLALLHSSTLQHTLSANTETTLTSYLDTRHTLSTLLHHELGNRDLCMVITRSPVEPSYVQLSHVSSERALRTMLDTFYAREDDVPFVLSCDPLYCSSAMITHARELMVQAAATAATTLSSSTYKKQAVFLMHVPVSVASRTRAFALELYAPWKYFFLDEVVSSSSSSSSSSLTSLLHRPLVDLITERMDTTLHTSFSLALSPPSLALTPSYVQIVHDLLHTPTWLAWVHHAIQQCVSNAASSRYWHRTMPLHLYRACESMSGGSLRHSIQRTLDTLILHAFAYVVGHLNVNYNLYWVYHHRTHLDAWLQLASDLVLPTLCATYQDTTASIAPDKNTSASNVALQCRFPFSYHWIHMCTHALQRAPDALLRSPAALTALLNPDVHTWVHTTLPMEDYIYDFVVTQVYPLPTITHDFVIRLLHHLFPNIGTNIATLHCTYAQHESQVYHLLSIASKLQRCTKDVHEVLDTLQQSLFEVLRGHYLSVPDFNKHVLHWTQQVTHVRSDMDAISGNNRAWWVLTLIHACLLTILRHPDMVCLGSSFVLPLVEVLLTHGYSPHEADSLRHFAFGVCQWTQYAPYASSFVYAYVYHFVGPHSLSAPLRLALQDLITSPPPVTFSLTVKRYVAHLLHTHPEELSSSNSSELITLCQERALCNPCRPFRHPVYCLNEYKTEIYTYARHWSSSPTSSPPVLPCWDRTEAQLYFLVCLMHHGGKSLLIQYLRSHVLPVPLPVGATAIDPQSAHIAQLDPFSMLCDYESYQSICAALIHAQLHGVYTEIHAWNKSMRKTHKTSATPYDRLCLVQAALHTQQVTNVPEDQLMKWMQDESFSLWQRAWTQCCIHQTHRHASLPPLLENLRMHTTMLAGTPTSGWLHTLLTNSKALRDSVLPSMHDDELVSIMMFTDERGRVQDLGWYTCPNGHRYAVGECTLPMQLAQCPECKAPIGGRNHDAVHGVTRLGRASDTATATLSHKGYLLSVTVGPQAYHIHRLGTLTTIVLRLLQHLVLLSAHKVEGSTVADLLFLPDTQVDEALCTRIASDWSALCASLPSINEEDVIMGMHLIVNHLYGSHTETKYSEDESTYGRPLTDEEYAQRLAGHAPKKTSAPITLKLPPANMTPRLRHEFEMHFEKHYVEATFSKPGSLRHIQQEKRAFEDTNMDAVLRQCLGSQYATVLQFAAPVELQTWRYHNVVSYSDACTRFHQVTSLATDFPVLAAVFAHDAILPKIKYLADILAWQAIVFRVAPSGSLTREQSLQLTQQDIVDRLPDHEREEGQRALQRFCHAFNETIVLPGMLVGCTPNVFRTPEGRPDISGRQGNEGEEAMHCGASLAFALPSLITSHERSGTTNGLHVEYKEPKSICPLFICDSLQRLQREMVAAFSQQKEEEVVEEEEKEKEKEKEQEVIPLTTYHTPRSIVLRRLMDYDRETHLIPLLYAHVCQDVTFEHGDICGYDYASIEAELRVHLLSTMQPLLLATPQYRFRDEVEEAGGLSLLADKIVQEELPEAVIDQLLDEVDLHDRYTQLMRMLDACVSFLLFFVGSSSTYIHPNTPLRTIVLDAMMLPEHEWNCVAGPTLNKHVCLKHIKSMRTGLDRRQHGGAFSTLDAQYRTGTLTEEEQAALSPFRTVKTVTNTVQDMLQYLCTHPVLDMCMKNNLVYMNDDLHDDPVYQSTFPASVTVASAWAVYTYLCV